MRVHPERALVTATVALAAATLAVPLLAGAVAVALPVVALFAAAAIIAEYFQVDGDERGASAVDARTLSFSTAIHIAAAIVAGPWVAALTAAIGVVVVDSLRGSPWRPVAFNASVFALAAFAGGHVFGLLGGNPDGLLVLTPADLLALVGLSATYIGLNTILVELVVAVSTKTHVLRNLRYSLFAGLPTDAAEAGLGGAVALFGLHRPWAMVLLAPLAIAVYHSHARLVLLRRQTTRALETFANVVDERDPYTRRHSERVADTVVELAERLGLPAAETARLRWAGRLHDLGKVAVDNAVLRKPGPLDDDEFEQMRRHARLSARILRRFEFAAGESLAVEYHHERYDGHGYYGIERGRIPLASHFLAVADTFDAMTSHRPYRRALPREVALREIELKSGTQFHPAVAKAFVALHRGEDPVAALSPGELAELRKTTVRDRRRPWLRDREQAGAALVAVAGSALLVAGVGMRLPAVIAAGAAVVVAAVSWRALSRRAAGRLVTSLASTQDEAGRDRVFNAVAEELARSAGADWAGLVVWRDDEAGGQVELEWGDSGRPSHAGIVSWLLREHDSTAEVLHARGAEVGAAADAAHLAVPIRRGRTVVTFVVFAFPGRVPAFVHEALRALPDELHAALSRESRPVMRPRAVAVSA
jgi:putative nucleotidyltransferase with HDIG domain